MSNINTILMVVAFVLLMVGLVYSIVGITEYESGSIIFGVTIFIAGLSIFIVRVLVNALIQITKSAEYYNAKVEAKYKISE